MSLPVKAIDRLFERLSTTYGSQWSNQWKDVPINDVKTLWGYELQGFVDHLDSVAWALENLPERSPNVIEVRNLCRKAPAREVPLLPEPKADPVRLKNELSKLGRLRERVLSTNNGHKDWAHRIIARYNAGEPVNPTSLRFAKEALA